MSRVFDVTSSPGRKVTELFLDASRAFIPLSPQLSGVQMDSFLFKVFACPFTISSPIGFISTGIFKKVRCYRHILHIAVGVDLRNNSVVLAANA